MNSSRISTRTLWIIAGLVAVASAVVFVAVRPDDSRGGSVRHAFATLRAETRAEIPRYPIATHVAVVPAATTRASARVPTVARARSRKSGRALQSTDARLGAPRGSQHTRHAEPLRTPDRISPTPERPTRPGTPIVASPTAGGTTSTSSTTTMPLAPVPVAPVPVDPVPVAPTAVAPTPIAPTSTTTTTMPHRHRDKPDRTKQEKDPHPDRPQPPGPAPELP